MKPQTLSLKKLAALLAAALFLAPVPASAQLQPAAPAAAAAETPAVALAGLKKDLFDRHVRFRPEFASDLGLSGHDARLSDLSEEAVRQYVFGLEAIAEHLAALEPRLPELSGQDRIDHAVMTSFVRGRLHDLRDRKDYLSDMTAVIGPYSAIQSQLSRIKPGAQAEKDWQAVLARVEATPAYLVSVRENLRRALAQGRVPDKTIAEEEGVSSAGYAAKFFGEELAGEAQKTLEPAGYARLEARLKSAGGKARLAQEELIAFVEAEILPKAKDNYVLGTEEYAWRVKNDFGINQSPEELNRKGLELADEIRMQMEALAAKIDSSKDLPTVIVDIRKEHPADDKAMLATYAKISDEARDFVIQKKLFNLPADYKLKIIPTPPGLRSTYAKAGYLPAPPLDPFKQGSFMVTPSEGNQQKLAGHSFADIVSIVVHEAFPGHDLQFYAFQASQKSGTIPPVRQLLGDSFAGNLNVEGYALYAEELMRQSGFFKDPKAELIELNAQLLRAWRVVVDTGMHMGRVTREEVAKIMEEKVFLSAFHAAAEAYRYSSIPTQAITYMLGRLQIEDLKEEYRKIKGAAFSEAEFHEAFLGFGPVQPSLIKPVLLEQALEKYKGLE